MLVEILPRPAYKSRPLDCVGVTVYQSNKADRMLVFALGIHTAKLAGFVKGSRVGISYNTDTREVVISKNVRGYTVGVTSGRTSHLWVRLSWREPFPLIQKQAFLDNLCVIPGEIRGILPG